MLNALVIFNSNDRIVYLILAVRFNFDNFTTLNLRGKYAAMLNDRCFWASSINLTCFEVITDLSCDSYIPLLFVIK